MSPVTGSSAALPYSPPAASGNTAAKIAAPKPSFTPAPTPPAAEPSSVPASSSVTLSDQARNAFANAAGMSVGASPAVAGAAGLSTYESMKKGISGAVDEIENLASDGLHAVANGVETVVSTANTLVQGVLDSPFVAVAKVCDAAGVVIDKI